MPSLADYLLANTSGGNFGTMSPGEEAVAVTPGSVLDAAARSAYQGMRNQPSWLEQAAAVRAQSDPTSLRPTPAEIDFAAGMVGPTALGIKAYHSSPHDFERFDLSKIGTGEGAQAYGHGLYFAENPEVSGQGGQYWREFKGHFDEPEVAAAEQLQRAGFDREAAIAASQRGIDEITEAMKSGKLHRSVIGGYTDPVLVESINKSLLRNRQEQHDLLTSGKPVGPRTYKVNINADPEHFLDYDKPLSEQPQKYKDFLQSQPWRQWMLRDRPNETLALDRNIQSPEYVAQLREAGIPGIKYLDQGSRTAGEGSRNYVVFDDKLIDILKKYGIAAGIIPAAGAALDRQQ